MRQFWKRHKVSKTINENKIEILPILRDWGLISMFGHVGPKFKKSV